MYYYPYIFMKNDVYGVEAGKRRASLNIISLQIAAAICFTIVFPQQYITIRYLPPFSGKATA
jgi:apolipoprotein N-acyltransferase